MIRKSNKKQRKNRKGRARKPNENLTERNHEGDRKRVEKGQKVNIKEVMANQKRAQKKLKSSGKIRESVDLNEME